MQSNILTGPHTSIAFHLIDIDRLDAIKASVPKLFSCPGASLRHKSTSGLVTISHSRNLQQRRLNLQVISAH